MKELEFNADAASWTEVGTPGMDDSAHDPIVPLESEEEARSTVREWPLGAPVGCRKQAQDCRHQ